MANALEWILKLRDGLSGPAAKMKGSLSDLKGGLEGVAGAVGDAVDGFKTLASNPVMGAVIDAYKLAGRLAVDGAKLAIDASSFREDSIAAFEHLLHSREAAADLFAKADDLAGDLALDDAKTVEKLRGLLSVGFGADTALGVVKAAADIAAIKGEAAGEAFSSLIATMTAKGKLDTRALNSLAGLGIKTEDVYNALATTLGKTRAEVEALVKAGKIDAATGMKAVLGAAEGVFGGAGAKAAQSFPKLLFRVKDALSDLFQHVDLTPLKDALSSVLDVLKGPAGARLQEAISTLFGSIFKVIGQAFAGPEGQARIVRLVNNLAGAIEVAAGIVVKYGPRIVSVLEWIFDTANKDSSGGGVTGVLMDIVRGVVDFMAAMARFDPVAAADAIVQTINKIFDIHIPTLSELLSALWSGEMPDFSGIGSSVGASIATGIASGITGAAGAVMAAIIGLCSNAIAWAKAILHISSPSKVFEGLGSFTAQGFAAGVANDNSAPSAMTAMVAPPPASVAARSGAAIGAASSGGGRGGGTVTIHINGGDLDKVRRVVAETLEDAGLAVA